jgi:hypothetical protein
MGAGCGLSSSRRSSSSSSSSSACMLANKTDLSVILSANQDRVVSGGEITYTMTIKSNPLIAPSRGQAHRDLARSAYGIRIR